MTAWVLVALLLLPAEALACATCVGAPWQKTDVGFYWSALFLMGVPFAVAGVIGGWLFYHSRRPQGPGGKWGWARFVRTRIDVRAEGLRTSRRRGQPRGEAGIDLRKEGTE